MDDSTHEAPWSSLVTQAMAGHGGAPPLQVELTKPQSRLPRPSSAHRPETKTKGSMALNGSEEVEQELLCKVSS